MNGSMSFIIHSAKCTYKYTKHCSLVLVSLYEYAYISSHPYITPYSLFIILDKYTLIGPYLYIIDRDSIIISSLVQKEMYGCHMLTRYLLHTGKNFPWMNFFLI
jgi:hypothetical protein